MKSLKIVKAKKNIISFKNNFRVKKKIKSCFFLIFIFYSQLKLFYVYNINKIYIIKYFHIYIMVCWAHGS